MAITIHTRLHEGIYRSSGGGQDRVVASFATGPRNLLKGISTLAEERASNVRGFGNIGCGKTWLEIDGVAVDGFDLDDVMGDDGEHLTPSERRWSPIKIESPTTKAARLLAWIASGTYAADKAATQAAMDAAMDSLYPA